MTAEEFIKNYYDENDDFIEFMREQMSELKGFNYENVPDLMVEFAKFHVDLALKRAHSNMQLPSEDLEFTLQAYPLDNIK